ncbi:hypothetical protein LZZ85_10550 [Terrimonas sp. NA20]|uniref:DUF3899 domain-containing protein n=1 Tax=Terrimonas ginsenosidimutans TaxID=2908004 RepID=A0ABS9KQX8_9BACT|nr:hypothetical protein [Terrimonas ginsenosidimutans]MCG2614724.1 hypothetical protein [Terrimonas ginsenosidimutans]
MRKIFLINFSLMERIADKKNGITTEDAAGFLTGVELFFLALVGEFIIIRLLPISVSLWFLLGVMMVLWYITHYRMRKTFRKRYLELDIRKDYKGLSPGRKRRYLMLSILIFLGIFLFFFAMSVMLIGGYLK